MACSKANIERLLQVGKKLNREYDAVPGKNSFHIIQMVQRFSSLFTNISLKSVACKQDSCDLSAYLTVNDETGSKLKGPIFTHQQWSIC